MERLIIQHCAPTLANLKTANLVNWRGAINEEDFKCCKENLKKKGVEITILSKRENGALLYVYRRKRLESDLSQIKAFSILRKFGYKKIDVDYCLDYLGKRIEESPCFPHEIGLFLSYPPEDVLGFIENKGQNFKYLGYWKVYCNECEARKTFERYKKCIEIYMKMYNTKGVGIERLTVAA